MSDNAIRLAATDIASKVDGPGAPIPPNIVLILQQLMDMLFADFCQPTPQQAVAYVNSTRFFRVRRLRKEVRRQVLATNPDCPDATAEQVVDAVMFRCKVCTLDEMQGYHAAWKASSPKA